MSDLETQLREAWKPGESAIDAAIERHRPQEIGSRQRVALVLAAAYAADAPKLVRALETAFQLTRESRFETCELILGQFIDAFIAALGTEGG
jgi:hypothetical protein